MRKKLFYGLIILCLFAVFIVHSRESGELLVSTLETCVKTVIPSVFPLSVLGALIGSGIAEFPRFLKRTVTAVFGVSDDGSGALLAGLFTGFPVGVSGGVGLYLRGRIDKDDLCRITAFSLTPSCAFVISGVGESMLGSSVTGVKIYLFVIAAVLLVGFLTKKRKRPKASDKRPFVCEEESPPFAEAFTASLVKSGNAMVTLCAFIVFFAQISLFLSKALAVLSLPRTASAILLGFTEVSVGCVRASRLEGFAGTFCTAVICAFGGLSLQLQSVAICAPCKIGSLFGKIIFLRLLVAITVAVMLALFLGRGVLY